MQTDQHKEAGHLLTLDGAAQNLATSTLVLQGNTKAAGAGGTGDSQGTRRLTRAVGLEHTARSTWQQPQGKSWVSSPRGRLQGVAVTAAQHRRGVLGSGHAAPLSPGRGPLQVWASAVCTPRYTQGWKEAPHPTRCNK